MTNLDFSQLNLQDALDIAILIEEEAEDRYREFAEMIGNRYVGDAYDVFGMMALNEAKHGAQLKERRKKLFENAKTRVNRDMILDVEAPDYGKPRRYMSPYQAMEVALDSEIKAYEFFASAIPYLKDKEVRALFEELKNEEVDHQNLIKRAMTKVPKAETADIAEEDLDEPPALG